MEHIEEIAERIRKSFDARTTARDQALAQTRTLIRYCAHAIRAIHRDEQELARQNLQEAQGLVQALQSDLATYPDLYYAGYTQDALKEYAEANDFDAVFLMTAQPMVYVSEAANLTDEVVAMYNERYPVTDD